MAVADAKSQAGMRVRWRPGWPALFVSLVAGSLAIFSLFPGSREGKSLAVLHGLCAQQPTLSYYLGEARLPFDARNRVQMIFHHLTTAPVPPASVAEGIPQLLSDLCLWMLGKDPADRPQNFEELHEALMTVNRTMGGK